MNGADTPQAWSGPQMVTFSPSTFCLCFFLNLLLKSLHFTAPSSFVCIPIFSQAFEVMSPTCRNPQNDCF